MVVDAQAVDSEQPLRGDAPKHKSKLWTVCIFVLVVEMCERLCYYSIGGTMKQYLTFLPNGYAGGQASAINASFTMLSYVSCFLGGYIADNQLGRYRTILYFAIVYFVGTVLVAIAVIPGFHNKELYLLGTLVFIALGTGAIKPNVMNFGAQQYDESIPSEKQEQTAFFSYFYMMINVGAGIAFGALVSVATSDAKPNDPGSGFITTYGIAAGAMGLAVLFFVSGTKRYKPEEKTVHKPMVSVLRKYICSNAKCLRGVCSILGWLLVPIYLLLTLLGSVIQSSISQSLTWAAFLSTSASTLLLIIAHSRNNWIKELPTPIVGAGISVESARATFALVPQLLLINIGFNVPYNAMNNAYPSQACQMDLRVFGAQLNGAFTNLGDCVAILIAVPIMEGMILPFIERRSGRRVSRRTKFIWGFALAILANASAVVIEDIRQSRPFILGDEGISKCAAGNTNPPIHMTDMSCFYAFIPMMITGVAEILVNPVVYSFAFACAPTQVVSIVQAFNLVAAGAISNTMTGPLANAIFPNNFNTAKLTKYWNEQNITGSLPSGADPSMWRAAGGCGGDGITGCGNVNYTYYANCALGLLCLFAYLAVSKCDDVKEEDLSLTPEDQGGSRSFVGAGERDAVQVN